MGDLLNVDEAIAQILATIQPLEPEIIHLSESLGRILAQDIISDTDLPPFDNSAMDGFAIKAEDSGEGQTLLVSMDIPAGFVAQETLQSGHAARIMTGAPIPDGADTVIPVEDTNADFSGLGQDTLAKTVTLYKRMEQGSAIRKRGENIHTDQKILNQGTLIGAAEIGMLASLGKARLSVIRQPRIAIVGSGDELVDIDQIPNAGQIRDSNSYALAALIKQDGGIPLRQAIAQDTPESIRDMFTHTLAQNPDMIVSSAGVSVGAADYIRAILDEIGEIGFWRINLRPGKPLAFGNISGIPFFGLPGNPVSTMVTYLVLVRPALLKLAGRGSTLPIIKAKLGESMTSDGRRTFARVQLKYEDGHWLAYETGTQSSGAHMSMVLADGLLIIPENIGVVPIGTELNVQLLKPLSQ